MTDKPNVPDAGTCFASATVQTIDSQVGNDSAGMPSQEVLDAMADDSILNHPEACVYAAGIATRYLKCS